MTTKRAALAIPAVPGKGGTTSIIIDGADLTNACRALTLRSQVGHITTLTLDLLLLEGIEVDGETITVIPTATRDALIALGWTPPGEAGDEQRDVR